MATGYEDYVVLQFTQPAAALNRCLLHLVELKKLQGVRTASDGVTYDPATLEAAIAGAERDAFRLAQTVNGVGRPRFVPTRRQDPGPLIGNGIS